MTLLRNELAPTCLWCSMSLVSISLPSFSAFAPKFVLRNCRATSISECIARPSALMMYDVRTSRENRNELRMPSSSRCWLSYRRCQLSPVSKVRGPLVPGVFTASIIASNTFPSMIPAMAPSGPAVINPRNPPIHFPIAISSSVFFFYQESMLSLPVLQMVVYLTTTFFVLPSL